MSNTAPQKYQKPTGETRNVSVNFTDLLDFGETLSGTPTVTASSSLLTTSNVAINTSGTMVILGTTVATSKAVQFRVAAGTTGKTYNCLITVATNESQTFKRNVLIDVVANTT